MSYSFSPPFVMFSTAAVAVWILCTVVVTEGLQLPGECPDVPRSHPLFDSGTFNKSSEYTATKLCGISFVDESSSYMFKNYNYYTVNLKFLKKKNKLALPWLRIVNPSGWYLFIKLEMDNTKITANSTITKANKHGVSSGKLGCYPFIFEHLEYWRDGNFLIFWSCRNLGDVGHDEALLVVSNESISYEAVMKDLNVTLRRYLSGPILDRIDWGPGFENVTRYAVPQYDCSSQPTTPIMIIIVVLILGCVLFYSICKEHWPRRNNTVCPEIKS